MAVIQVLAPRSLRSVVVVVELAVQTADQVVVAAVQVVAQPQMQGERVALVLLSKVTLVVTTYHFRAVAVAVVLVGRVKTATPIQVVRAA